MALAQAGAHVVVAARETELLNDVVAQVNAQGLSAEAAPLDVTDRTGVTDFFNGQTRFDILCNSAGLTRHSSALETTEINYDAVMDVNVKAAYFLAQQAAKMMVGHGSSIIQISSQMGQVGSQDRAVYRASKHVVEGMNKAMAIGLNPKNIRLNTVCPTFIKTPLNAAIFADADKVA
jgi:2-deoxy-D-gluconate 3-dehydrogenase